MKRGSSALKLAVKVVPKSSRNVVAGWMGDTLKVCVSAAPERGKANAAVEEVLATALGIPRKSVRLVAGESSPRKLFEIEGLDLSEVRDRLTIRQLCPPRPDSRASRPEEPRTGTSSRKESR